MAIIAIFSDEPDAHTLQSVVALYYIVVVLHWMKGGFSSQQSPENIWRRFWLSEVSVNILGVNLEYKDSLQNVRGFSTAIRKMRVNMIQKGCVLAKSCIVCLHTNQKYFKYKIFYLFFFMFSNLSFNSWNPLHT